MNKYSRKFFVLFAGLFLSLALTQTAFASCADLIGDLTGCPPSGGTESVKLDEPDSPAQGIDLGLQHVTGTGLPSRDVRLVVGDIISTALGFLGVIMLGIVIYSGFLWMTSGGDEGKAESAKKWLSGAVIGLIIILCSYAISAFIISRLVTATAVTAAPY